MKCIVCERETKSPDGIGPDCRKKYKLSDIGLACCRNLTRLSPILPCDWFIRFITEGTDFPSELKDLLRKRHRLAKEKVCIEIWIKDGTYHITSPYCRKAGFVDAWRAIPGRQWVKDTQTNIVPLSQKRAVWEILKKYYKGCYGNGWKGLFRVP